MDLASFAKTVAKFAPLLGSVLPIPGGTVIGEIIAHEFGGDASNLDDLANRIVTDPNAQLKLVEIQNNTKVQLQQLSVQNIQNQLAAQTAIIESDRLDRANARQNNARSYMPEIVTFLIFTGFIGACYMLISGNAPKADQQVIFMMLGTISTAFGGAVTYWLGSSNGSHVKDVAIHNTLAKLSAND